MDPEFVFSVTSHLTMAAWVVLVVVPRKRAIVDAVAGIGVPVLLSVAYAALIASSWLGSAGGFTSLADVALLFENRWLLLAGWIHYLAFDLLVGRWELLDSQSRGMPHALLIPCLLGTFMFGPAGWLLYLGLRGLYRAPSTRVHASI